MSRQNFYKEKKARERREVDEELIVDLVKAERRKHKKMGGRKLLDKLQGELKEAGVKVGRDRFFEILRKYELLVERRKSSTPRTTDSRHRFRTYENLFADFEPSRVHEAWVSDLTYIRTEEGFMYMSHVTDSYSRKIIGYHISDSLEAVGCLEALDQAIKQLPEGKHPIHHSDRGTQYCCNEYVNRLNKHGLQISMTQENHCYENSQAERVIGILKDEYSLSYTFNTKLDALRAARQAVELYNEDRPHMSHDNRMPSEVHKQAA